MDSHEAASAVFSRIQSIDPDNASKIIAYILLQDQAEKEMIRLAFGPENLIHSVICKAKTELGLPSNASSAQSSSPPSSISNPISISKPNHPHPLSLPSPRLSATHPGFNPSSPSSPSLWSIPGSNNRLPLSPDTNHSLSYAAVVNGGASSANASFSSPLSSSQIGCKRDNFVDDYRLSDQNMPFLNEPLRLQRKNSDFLDRSFDMAMSPGGSSDSMLYPPYWENSSTFENGTGGHLHRRSCSVNDVCFGTDDSTSGFGYKPCLYFARGFCKNGSTCKFVHGAVGGGFTDSIDTSGPIVGSPGKFDALDQCQQELLRTKVAQQQRLATAQFMAGVNFPYNKLNFLHSEAQRSAAAAALMMGDELHKLNRCRIGRHEFSGFGCGESNPGARQIYLTFPADSTFKEEDVSNYFSIYGPVQDVRIPYQQKRMFGFVTFVYADTVKIILAKGNPHFVCDSRVLVKPYKEKGKLPDKKHQQHDRSEFSSCSSPSGLDREPFEMHVGPRMLYNNQEIMLRKKLEEHADWQQALELQSRRLMNLQLMDLKSRARFQKSVPVGSPPTPHSQSHSHNVFLNRSLSVPTNGILQDAFEGNKGTTAVAPTGQLQEEANAVASEGSPKEDNLRAEDSDILPESFEHVLPDCLFASPTKLASEDQAVFSGKSPELGNNGTISASGANNDTLMPPTSSLNMATLKPCFLEIPRFSSGHGAIGM